MKFRFSMSHVISVSNRYHTVQNQVQYNTERDLLMRKTLTLPKEDYTMRHLFYFYQLA